MTLNFLTISAAQINSRCQAFFSLYVNAAKFSSNQFCGLCYVTEDILSLLHSLTVKYEGDAKFSSLAKITIEVYILRGQIFKSRQIFSAPIFCRQKLIV